MVLSRRKFIIQSFSIMSLAGALSACSCRKGLKVAVFPWIGYEPLYLAEELKFLPKNIRLVKGQNSSQSIELLRLNQVDAAALTLDEVLHARSKGIALTVVLVFDTSAGADMLLARQDIDTLSQLKGKRIAFEANALGELVMQKILEKAGLTEKDIIRVDISPDQQVQAWQEGQMDAVITYQPTAAFLLQAGARTLFNSREIPETIFDVLAVKTDVLDHCGQTVRSLVKANFQALDHLNTNLGDSLYRIANNEKLAPEEVKTALRGVVFPGMETNRNYLTKQSSFYRSAQALNQLMVQKGLLPKPDDFKQLFSNQYLPESEHESF